MSLVDHAKRELSLINEDADTVAGVVKVVEAFASCGHSGGSAPVAISYLERLLRFQPLSPLTADPDEWEDRTEMSGTPLWQSKRNPEAFSTNGGGTYYLPSEMKADGVAPNYYPDHNVELP